MNQSQDLYGKIRIVLGRVFDEVPEDIGPQTTAADVQGWDSLNHINVILALEKEFQIKFTSAQVESVKNLGQIADIIAGKQQKT